VGVRDENGPAGAICLGDLAGKQAKLEAPKAAAPKVESPIEEPTKREKKADPKPTVKKDLDSVVKAWSDED
jgi:hypothetical protein